MKNKPRLVTLILTILFSFVITSVVWAECTIEISPSNAIVLPGGFLCFTAETTCDGVVQTAPSYTWEIVASDCTSPSLIDENGLICIAYAPEACGCVETIRATDTAYGNIFAEAIVTISGCCLPEVTISGPATLGVPCPASGTYTAETECGGSHISGTYTWELDGISAGTGDSFEIPCIEDGTKILTVTDTANGNITDLHTIECDCVGLTPPIFEATFAGCGTALIPWFGFVTMQGIETIFGPLTTVSYDSPLVLKLPRLVNRTSQTITQFVLLWPSILFPAGDYPTMVQVTVCGPSSAYRFSDTLFIPKCGQ